MKIACRIFAGALILYLVLSIVGTVLTMDIPRLSLNGSPASVGLTYDDVSFPSRGDGVTPKGWYLPGRGNSIIIVHGGFQNRVDDNVST